MFYLFGLGNCGEEYKMSRHNTGKMAVDFFVDKNPLISKKIKIIEIDNFMNNSGRTVLKVMAGKKKFDKLIVVYDDLDLPLGTIKISYNKSGGGHKGLESIIKSIKSREFVRIRIGISPSTPSGKLKKPKGEKAVIDFILGDFKPKETEILKKVFKKVSDSINSILEEGLEKAMNLHN